MIQLLYLHILITTTILVQLMEKAQSIFTSHNRAQYILCLVPGHPVWLRQLQLLHGAESLSHLTTMGP